MEIDSDELRRRLRAGERVPIDDDLVIVHRGLSGTHRISNIHRGDDGELVWDVEDGETDDTARAIQPPLAPPNHAARPLVDRLYGAIGDLDWTRHE